MLEFLIMSHIEDKCNTDNDFYIYVGQNCDIDKFNNRYGILLDEFLNQYAPNKKEKSWRNE